MGSTTAACKEEMPLLIGIHRRQRAPAWMGTPPKKGEDSRGTESSSPFCHGSVSALPMSNEEEGLKEYFGHEPLRNYIV
jgi:hypothetical protein